MVLSKISKTEFLDLDTGTLYTSVCSEGSTQYDQVEIGFTGRRNSIIVTGTYAASLWEFLNEFIKRELSIQTV